MALNYSHRPIFPAYMPEDNLGHGDSQEKDIYDILPADPFGMDISSTVTAISWWLKYMGVSDCGGCRKDECGGGVEDVGYQICGGSNKFDTLYRSDRFVSEDVFRHSPDVPENIASCSYGNYSFGEAVMNVEFGYYNGESSFYDGYGTMDNVMFEGGGCSSSIVYEEENREVGGVVDGSFDESPHPALSFALAHLGVRDLLAVERACKSLRFSVQNDPLLWRNIQIDPPLNTRISDNVLVELCSRAQGLLQLLRIVDCKLITNEGIRRVLESSPSLTKLSILGCKSLKLDGILDCLRVFQSKAVPGIKCIQLAGISITPEQYKTLSFIIGQPDHRKPRFFYRGTVDPLYEDDDRPIDVEICPKCQLVKLVYDCTAECCRGEDQVSRMCRACIQCINRCYQCGRCIDSVVHEEDFFLDYVCSDCSPTKSMCQNVDDLESCLSTHVSHDLDG